MTMLLLMRVLHVVLGVFWAGAVFLSVLYLIPSMREIGPGAAGLMPALKRRGYFTVLPVAALLTLVSGFWLYLWHMNAGGPEAAAAWRASGQAKAFNVGAVASVVAFIIGMIWIQPNNVRAIKLIEQLGSLPAGADRAAVEADLGRARARSWLAMRAAAALLFVAVVAMAVARYQ